MIYTLLLKNISGIDLLSLSEAETLDDALDDVHKRIIVNKGNPAFYSLATYLKLDPKQKPKLEVKESVKENKQINKQNFINIMKLIQEDYATKSQKAVLERLINKIHNN